MSGGKRFRWIRKYIKPKGPKTEITVAGKTVSVAGGWKRPRCTKCGKKIRDIRKLTYIDGKPYHRRCVDENI